MQDASIKIGPELNFFKEYDKVKSGSEIYLLGYNEYNVAKILYDNKELYIDGNLLTNNKNYIFNNVDDVVYAKNNTKAYNLQVHILAIILYFFLQNIYLLIFAMNYFCLAKSNVL